MSERQKNRVIAPVGVLLKIDNVQEPCFTRNISPGGTFVMTKRHAAIDDTLTLSFVHEGQKLTTTARVASATEDGLGIRFVDPSAEFRDGINMLIRTLLRKDDSETPLPTHQIGVSAAWSYIPEAGLRNLLRRKKRQASLNGLSYDGAALESRRRPDIEQDVLIFLHGPDSDEELKCQARVVRHTDKGFAVQFDNPSVAFRRVVSELRRNGLL